MFGILTGSSAERPAPLSFNDKELDQIFNSFDFKDSKDFTNIVRLSSGDGITTRQSLSSKIDQATASTDNTSAEELAQDLDITIEQLHEIRQKATQTVLTKDGQHIRSAVAVRTIRNSLARQMKSGFVQVERFLDSENVHSSDYTALFYGQEFSLPAVPHGFIISPALAQSMQQKLLNCLDKALQLGELAELIIDHYPDLDHESFRLWVESNISKGQNDGKACCFGRLLAKDHFGSFMTSSSASHTGNLWFAQRDVVSKRVASIMAPLMRGDEISFNLMELEKEPLIIPGGFDSTQRVLSFLSNDLCDEHGRRFPVIAKGNIVISQDRLTERVTDLWTHRKEDGFLNLRPTAETYPDIIQDTVIEHALAQASSMMDDFVRSEGASDDGNLSAYSVDAFLYSPDFLQAQILPEMRRRARYVAERQWAEDTETAVSILDFDATGFLSSGKSDASGANPAGWAGSPEADDFYQRVTKTRDRKAHNLHSEAHAVFKQTIEELSESAFASTWRDRLTARSQLYTTGLEGLAEGPLREQLAELLNDHVTTELFPQAVKRATDKSRGLINDKTLKRLDKLRTKMKESPGLTETNTYLAKFQEAALIRITPLSSDELAQRQKAELASLYKIAQEDKDLARRFLCAVLILHAAQAQGILYATGKFAPKLLKALNRKISDADYATMDSFKNEAKKGKLEDGTMDSVGRILDEAIKQANQT